MPARNRQGARVSTKEGRERCEGVDGKKKWEMKYFKCGKNTVGRATGPTLFSGSFPASLRTTCLGYFTSK